MKIKNLDEEMSFLTSSIECVGGEWVVNDRGLKLRLGEIKNREVDTLYIVDGSDCEPVLMVEWRWWLNEDDQYALFSLTYTSDELHTLYDIGVL